MLNVIIFLWCVLMILTIIILICGLLSILIAMISTVLNALKDCRVRKKS